MKPVHWRSRLCSAAAPPQSPAVALSHATSRAALVVVVGRASAPGCEAKKSSQRSEIVSKCLHSSPIGGRRLALAREAGRRACACVCVCVCVCARLCACVRVCACAPVRPCARTERRRPPCARPLMRSGARGRSRAGRRRRAAAQTRRARRRQHIERANHCARNMSQPAAGRRIQ